MDVAQAYRIAAQADDTLRRLEVAQAGVATAATADRKRLIKLLENSEARIGRLKRVLR